MSTWLTHGPAFTGPRPFIADRLVAPSTPPSTPRPAWSSPRPGSSSASLTPTSSPSPPPRPPGPPSQGDTDDTDQPSRPGRPAPAHHGSPRSTTPRSSGTTSTTRTTTRLRLLVEDWLTATTATPRRSRSRPGSSPATGPWWVSARPPPPLPLTAGIPDLAFTPISLDSTIEDLRAGWSTPPSPPFAARER